MALEPSIQLSKAAEIAGVDAQTLILWLEEDGVRVPALGRGKVRLVKVEDFERVRGRRMAGVVCRRPQFKSLQSNDCEKPKKEKGEEL